VSKLKISPSLAYNLVRAVQWIPGFPVNDEQVMRMQEDKVFDISKAVAELGYSPRSFEEGIGWEIQQMRSAGMVRERVGK
jgi:nucleoside-diphosphate-sugar epimerase